MMEWLQSAAGVAATLATLAGSLMTLGGIILVLVKKVKKMIQDNDYKGLVDMLKVTADAAIRAQQDAQISGADKKTQVLEMVQAACVANGAEFTDELQDNISAFIDQSVAEYNEFNAKTAAAKAASTTTKSITFKKKSTK